MLNLDNNPESGLKGGIHLRIANNIYQEPAASNLDALRVKSRATGKHLTYDCRWATIREDRVACAKGRILGASHDGTAFALAILRGVSMSACQGCEDFISMGDE